MVAALLIAVVLSASTCIMPGSLSRAYADWVETPTPQTYAVWQREAARWPIFEHAVLAGVIFVPAALILCVVNLLIQPRSTSD